MESKLLILGTSSLLKYLILFIGQRCISAKPVENQWKLFSADISLL